MYIKLEPPDKNEDSFLTLPKKSYENHITQKSDDEQIKIGHKDGVSDTVIPLNLVLNQNLIGKHWWNLLKLLKEREMKVTKL